MIFNEVYGIYYNVVGKILKEAVKGEISLDKIKEITGKEAFGESITVIPDKLLKKQWPLMDDNFETPLKNNPDMPLTTIEKMWQHSLMADVWSAMIPLRASSAMRQRARMASAMTPSSSYRRKKRPLPSSRRRRKTPSPTGGGRSSSSRRSWRPIWPGRKSNQTEYKEYIWN